MLCNQNSQFYKWFLLFQDIFRIIQDPQIRSKYQVRIKFTEFLGFIKFPEFIDIQSYEFTSFQIYKFYWITQCVD